jgi:endonuclease/exonuclease/phosphatase family metal-dependent hydrolase
LTLQSTKSTSDYFTIAFYNLENLFDTFDNHQTYDDDFLPSSEKQWTPKRYKKKVRKLGYAISNIGVKTAKKLPAIVGLAEVENKLVVNDLLDSKFLKKHAYDYVHYDSPDERGIDVALIYHKDYFKLHWSEVYSLELYDDDGTRDYTRDILLVNGDLNNENLYIIVNHWPSRREGQEASEPSRLIASNKVLEIITSVKSEDPNAKIIIMGDFNDGPHDISVQQLTTKEAIYNPMEALNTFDKGSLNHRFQWNLFDQILISTNFFEHTPNTHSFSKANIFDKTFLKQFEGKYKGNPFRTYVGKKYKGGYSDHFPVYIHLKKK